MNYFILLARLFLVLFSAFFLLFAVGEGITGEGFVHVLPPVCIALILIFLWDKPGWSAVATTLLFGVSIWFFKTYTNPGIFLSISLPLLVSAILFLLGMKNDRSRTV